MTLAGMIDGTTLSAGEAAASGGVPAFAAIETSRSVDDAAQAWAGLMPDALATPYQSPAFLKAWADNVATREGVEPAIVSARDAQGRVVAVLPFGLWRRFGVRVASFLGGSHVNYNMAVIRRDRLASFTPSECLRLLGETAAANGVDMFALCNQPESWDGAANPFAALPRQPSPAPAFSGPLAASLEDHLKLFTSPKSRSNQRRKMRRFEERGTPRIYRAETEAERRRLLDAYLAQKAAQFADRGIANVFARPGVAGFLAEAVGLQGCEPTVDLYGFDLDDETIAVTGGLADGRRYCGMFISITNGEHAKYSPGEMLMNFAVEDSIRRGLRTFDLGVGAATYKKMYCPNLDPLWDSVLGMTAAGRVAAAGLRAKTAAKAAIKSNPRAFALVERYRRFRAGRRDGAQEPSEG